MNKVAIPKEYTIFRQDLTKDYLQVEKMGLLHSFNEAIGMCKVFNETDKDVLIGKCNYFLICSEIQNENNG